MSTTAANTRKRGPARSAQPDESNTSVQSSSQIVDEEKELIGLNSRLATYIERVRQLELENRTLEVKIKDIEVVEKREKKDLQARFSVEQARLREALEIKNNEMAKLVVERDSAFGELDELRARAHKAENALKAAEDAKRRADSLLDDANSRAGRAISDAKKFETENKELVRDMARLRDALNAAKRSLEEESVLRASLQAKLEGALEDLEFQNRNLKSQLEENSRRQVEMTTISRQLQDEYEDRLREQLEEARILFQEDMRMYRENKEASLYNKLNEVEEEMQKVRASEGEMRVRLREAQSFSRDYESRLADLEKKYADLLRSSALEADLYRSKLSEKDKKIAELHEEIERLQRQMDEIIEKKMQLDNELRTYNSLLESEESRLNISAVRSPRVSIHSYTTSTNTSRGTKRRRLEDDDFSIIKDSTRVENHAVGDIKIAEVGEKGQFVRLQNTSEKDVSVGGWKVSISGTDEVDGKTKEVTFKFHSKAVIKAGGIQNVWSQSSGHEHKPPTDLLMKAQSWPVCVTPSVRLEDNHNEKVAWQEHVITHIRKSGRTDDPNERCSIM